MVRSFIAPSSLCENWLVQICLWTPASNTVRTQSRTSWDTYQTRSSADLVGSISIQMRYHSHGKSMAVASVLIRRLCWTIAESGTGVANGLDANVSSLLSTMCLSLVRRFTEEGRKLVVRTSTTSEKCFRLISEQNAHWTVLGFVAYSHLLLEILVITCCPTYRTNFIKNLLLTSPNRERLSFSIDSRALQP